MENLYETDFYSWINQQTELFKQRRLDELDVENLIEELESMGGSERHSLTSHIMQLLMHLLKWQYQPSRRSRSWQDSIINHRFQTQDTLSENPGLKTPLPELYDRAYKKAVALAVKQTGLPKNTFPKECPWIYEQVMEDGWLPNK
ncbi:MAG: DUF29 domain-containing protein [Endozoicomonas sp.]|uniref:DUF29 domain-containing protein n=1 Tax=Endozoicomonas sp. TaxID=1892382 RepID=UPI003D9BC4F0